MKKEIIIETALQDYRSIFSVNFDPFIDDLIINRPFKKIIIKIDIDPSYNEPFLIATSDGICEVIINFFEKPTEETFLIHVKKVLSLIE